MHQFKILASIALASAFVSSCASNSTADATQADYDAAVVEAKESLKTANAANYEWRDSGKILGKAEKAAKAGDFPAATELANQANKQGELALAQSKEQAKAGPR